MGGEAWLAPDAITTSLLTGEVPHQAVLRTERWGPFTYTIPDRAPGTAQRVTLYFQESVFSAEGKRIFDVTIGGVAALTAFDIFREAGGARRAIARTFETKADAAGQVVIRFLETGHDHAKVNAITVSDAPPPGAPPPGPAP